LPKLIAILNYSILFSYHGPSNRPNPTLYGRHALVLGNAFWRIGAAKLWAEAMLRWPEPGVQVLGAVVKVGTEDDAIVTVHNFIINEFPEPSKAVFNALMKREARMTD
jgi:hypothetical protein